MAPIIPDRWIPYKACGKIIEGTRIICFKVPLRKNVQIGQVEKKEIWDIKTLLVTIPGLGAVVDLTNTTRYYDPRELQAAGVLHKKILMPGRIIPPEVKVQEFMDTVDEYLGKDCEFLVGVHCTHGLNRTGYMVCRYMRDRLGVPAKDAIKKFEKARGYQIERDNYIADLLGSTPPPADTGDDTKMKPVQDDGGEEYRSPLNYYDDDEYTNSRRRYNKTNRDSDRKPWRSNITKHSAESLSWRNRDSGSKITEQSAEPKSWRIRDSDSTRGKESMKWNSGSKRKHKNTDKPYDYKYDY